MKNLKSSLFSVFTLLALGFFIILSCKNNNENPQETIIAGSATVFVDESIYPLIEDHVDVFESQYNAKIKLVSQPESEVVNSLLSDKANLAVLSRKLNAEEEKYFISKNISPKITPFATDAIALITSRNSKDTLVDLQEVIYLMQGKDSKIKQLVFENPNSSTVTYMNNLANVKSGTKNKIYSLKSHEDVLKYVSENNDVIGVVGLNLIVQPTPNLSSYLEKINVMAVKNVKNKPNNLEYYKPSQSNLGAGLYPLQRELYMLNYQGSAGLGIGFASFMAGEIGQRIILKAGLLPIRMPSRSIIIRKQIENK